MDIPTPDDEIITLSQNFGHLSPSDAAPYRTGMETSTALL
jgi:hypothetical protein